jgi:uncharacterized surface protein with fasciclin (FAS1) repeats
MKDIHYNKRKGSLKKAVKWLGAALLAMHLPFFVSCVDNDDDVPESRYSSTKLTAAQFLEENQDRLGDFITLLKRTPYFSLLTTYGNYTVFAPNNEAISNYMAANSFDGIDNIPQDVCDTLVRSHIIKGEKAHFTTDRAEGTLGMNMADTYIELNIATDTLHGNAVVHYANKVARMVEFDDSVSNGVVHIVSSVIPRTSDKLPDLIAKDSTLTIFSDALFMTGMSDSLMAYIDETYPEWGSDPTSQDSVYSDRIKVACLSGDVQEVSANWPEKRLFKFTAFVEPDEVYRAHGINNIEDLKAYAKQVYDAVYPEDAGKYDNDFKNRKNPLNRFVSYHLIDRFLNYDEVVMNPNFLSTTHWDKKKADPEEFYETMCPGTIMRFCLVGKENQLYINRKGLATNASIKGIAVKPSSSSGSTLQQSINGIYHYVDDIVEFSRTVHDEVLNCRLRFDANVLSPDFQNSGARGREGVQKIIAFRLGFIKNWKVMGEQAFLGLHGDGYWWSSYKGNALNINGIFDVTFKLPPVPSGTYEIRTGYTSGSERGVVQFYLNDVPCDIPADLRVHGTDPNIGWVADVSDETDNAKNKNKAIDKAMRNHGYMKGMDTWCQGADPANTLRSHGHNLRKILTTTYLDEHQTYYIRARQVLYDPKCYWNFDYLELCPKSVYDSPQGEDQH